MSIKNKIIHFVKQKNTNPMNNRKKVGIILFATSIGLFFLFAFRLTYLVTVGQVAGVSLPEKTAMLYTESRVVKAKRGSIFDRNGNVIAEDATSYSLYAVLDKNYIGVGKKRLYAEQTEFPQLAKILSEYTNLSESEALEKLNFGIKKDGSVRYQVEFGNNGKNISLETKQKIEAALEEAGLVGIYFTDHPARIYPNGIFASHFIGYATLADDDDESKGLTGIMGLEAAYNDVLSGQDGRIEYERDVSQNPLPGTVATEKQAVDGQNIYTTLDLRLQSRLESLLDEVMTEYEPENLTAMLVKADTGEIYAMSQRPSFNPETRADVTEWMDLLTQYNFEPGSTMKILLTAAAMQQGIFDPNATFEYPNDGKQSGYKLDDRYVNDHDRGLIFQRLGPLTFRQALSWSSNVGMLTLERMMTEKTWMEYVEKFGFGRSTDSGLPYESSGFLPTENWVDQAMSSFGQAISVTNFQMMQAFLAIANDGTMLKPQYISKMVDPTTGVETVTTLPEKVGEQVVSADITQEVREYMTDTVESELYGVAYNMYKVPGYRIAAKTGTAEINDGVNGYLTGELDYTYSVVTMIPSDKPEFVLYVTMKQPKKAASEALPTIVNPLLRMAMGAYDQTEDTATDETTAE